jgi:surface antigen
MKRIVAFAALGIAGFALAGCDTTGSSGGPALGLVESGQAAQTPIGSFAGRGLSTSAQKKASEAEYRALEFGRTGIPVAWKDGSSRGEVTPGAPYQVNAFSCRDYTHVVSIDGGAPLSGRGTACRQENGAWQAVT